MPTFGGIRWSGITYDSLHRATHVVAASAAAPTFIALSPIQAYFGAGKSNQGGVIVGTDALIEKAMRRGRAQMLPLLFIIGPAQWLGRDYGASYRLVGFVLAMGAWFALQWYYSRHPLAPAP